MASIPDGMPGGRGENVDGLVRAVQLLYTSFLLRDFVGKTVPGLIVLGGLKQLDVAHFEGFEGLLKGPIAVPFMLAVAWLTGFAVQQGAGLLGSPVAPHEPAQRHLSMQFLRTASQEERALHERYVVTKEATLNTASALAFLFLAHAIAIGRGLSVGTFLWKFDATSAAIATLWIGAIGLLWLQGREAARNQRWFRDAVLEAGPSCAG